MQQNLVDEDREPIQVRLLPGLAPQELEDFARSLPSPLPDDVRDLISFCSGMEGTLAEVDFVGRLGDGFEHEALPNGLPVAHDGFGNYWVVDLQSDPALWGPIYFCCHDAPVMLLQSFSIEEFVVELFKMYTPPHKSLVDDVHEDRLFDVWRRNPGVIQHADALNSADADIRAFAGMLTTGTELIDLRDAPIGMGFSWGRYGPRTEVQRFGSKPIFAYRKPEKLSLFSRLFGR